MLRNSREGIRQLVEKHQQERNLYTKETNSADAPRKVLKVKPLSQVKAIPVVAVKERNEGAILPRHEIVAPNDPTINLPKDDRLPRRKGPRFEETHVRLTNYLQKELYAAVQALRKSGEIESVTALLDASVRITFSALSLPRVFFCYGAMHTSFGRAIGRSKPALLTTTKEGLVFVI
ncbi:hypothetical protein ACLBWT_10155 [Paenibacillus sp. D51F]